MDPFFFTIIVMVVFLLVLHSIIRGAIDSSKLTKQVEALTAELQSLRKLLEDKEQAKEKQE